MEIAIIIGSALASLAIGFFFGGLPLLTSQMSEQQNKYQQLMGIVAVGIVLVLIILKQDLSSWIAILAMAIGVGIAKIPPIHHWLIASFPFFKPENKPEPKKKTPTAKSKR